MAPSPRGLDHGAIEPIAPRCKNHPNETASVACGTCGIRLCDRCFAFTLDGAPGCARCAYEADTRVARKATQAVAFVGVILGGGFFALRGFHAWDELVAYYVIAAVVAVAGAVWYAWPRADARAPKVEPRDERVVPEDLRAPKPHPYRARARALVFAVTPRVSARWTILLLLGSFAVTAVLVPSALRLPRWVEWEIVLVGWWAIFTVALTILLHRGYRLRHDFVLAMPWQKTKREGGGGSLAGPGPKASSGWGSLDGCSGCSGLDGEGVVFLLVLAVVVGLGAGMAWLIADLAAPILFFVLYTLLGAAIRRVAHDRHGLEGRLVPSLGWGALWAGIYVVPFAVVVALVHAAMRR